MPRPIGRITPTRRDDRPVKITFAEMREMGVRGVLVSCADYRCGHHIALSADRWPDEVRLSDIEPRIICTACGKAWRRCPSGLRRRQVAGSTDDIETRQGDPDEPQIPSRNL
jgi:hypothetical protein